MAESWLCSRGFAPGLFPGSRMSFVPVPSFYILTDSLVFPLALAPLLGPGGVRAHRRHGQSESRRSQVFGLEWFHRNRPQLFPLLHDPCPTRPPSPRVIGGREISRAKGTPIIKSGLSVVSISKNVHYGISPSPSRHLAISAFSRSCVQSKQLDTQCQMQISQSPHSPRFCNPHHPLACFTSAGSSSRRPTNSTAKTRQLATNQQPMNSSELHPAPHSPQSARRPLVSSPVKPR